MYNSHRTAAAWRLLLLLLSLPLLVLLLPRLLPLWLLHMLFLVQQQLLVVPMLEGGMIWLVEKVRSGLQKVMTRTTS